MSSFPFFLDSTVGSQSGPLTNIMWTLQQQLMADLLEHKKVNSFIFNRTPTLESSVERINTNE